MSQALANAHEAPVSDLSRHRLPDRHTSGYGHGCLAGQRCSAHPRFISFSECMDPLLVTIILGACAAGFIQGLSGFAFGLVAMAFWAWAVPPQLAAPLVVFGSLVGQLLAVGSLRRSFALRRALPFILGGVLGVPAGAALLPH